ncbi:DMT family transporter [Roseiarcaceae bacterium H3SJ34-1]|uniref:DMT family transporter n=1 Tax=Terripilifer ovatus TaxID=3032367 RepID=UPI003AB975A2|nr:DMT family transporter [Roseiarcaceae bacterium H3SJ34-1]
MSNGRVDEPAASRALDVWFASMPALFVFFWSTGFIAGKLGLGSSAPFTLLLYRFAIVTTILVAVSVIQRAPWPRREDLLPIAIGGILVHAGYLGATFAALATGVETGVSALVAGLQPILTAVLAAPFLGERTTGRQWAGLVIGLTGTTLVVWNKLGLGLGTPIGMFFAFLSVVCMTTGTLWQKRFGGRMDLRTGSVVQFLASGLVILPLAWWEGFRHTWTPELVISLAWLCLVLSVGTISLLFVLIRRGAASEVASLFFLVPPTTALMAYFLFHETLGPTAFAGMALVVVAVAMVSWKNKPR